jgi:hypothetical protein
VGGDPEAKTPSTTEAVSETLLQVLGQAPASPELLPELEPLLDPEPLPELELLLEPELLPELPLLEPEPPLEPEPLPEAPPEVPLEPELAPVAESWPPSSPPPDVPPLLEHPEVCATTQSATIEPIPRLDSAALDILMKGLPAAGCERARGTISHHRRAMSKLTR